MRLATASLLSVSLLVPAALAQKEKPVPPVVVKTFSYPKTKVWNAMTGALAAEDLFPQASDPIACTMNLRELGIETLKYGDANRTVAKFTTKRVKSTSTWMMLSVSGTIECKPNDDGSTEVRLELQFVGHNTVSARFENLISSGELEKLILKGIEGRLDPNARPAEKKNS